MVGLDSSRSICPSIALLTPVARAALSKLKLFFDVNRLKSLRYIFHNNTPKLLCVIAHTSMVGVVAIF